MWLSSSFRGLRSRSARRLMEFPDSRRTVRNRSAKSGRLPRTLLSLERLEDRTVPSAGMLDATFSTGGKVTANFGVSNSNVMAATIQPNGQIVLLETSSDNSNSPLQNWVIRRNIER
jgi:hypothetical protein